MSLMKNSKEKILLIMAHPDDELIWGWPFLQSTNWDKEVIIFTSDYFNEKRSFCKFRKKAYFKFMDLMGIDCYCYDFPSSFHRELNSRCIKKSDYSNLAGVEVEVAKLLKSIEGRFDGVFTHNPYGEYGHLDHLFLFQMVVKHSNIPIYYTDIKIKSNWSAYDIGGKVNSSIYYKNRIFKDHLNVGLLNFGKKIYEEFNGWTWSRQIPNECNVFKL